MTRPTIDQTLIDMALVMSRRSTCARNSVGCVFALDGRVLATGYNGAPRGMPHCDHECNCHQVYGPANNQHNLDCNSGPNGCVAVHAEANAVSFAARYGIALEASTAYVTLAPCVRCAQLLVNAGVREVVYRHAYRDPAGVELLLESGISCWQQPKDMFD